MHIPASESRAQQLIAQLGLQPHPEGGYFRELFRSALPVQPLDSRPLRAALTTIYFLLPRGAHSRWHRVQSDEVWHLYEGDPLRLLIADPALSSVQVLTLGAVTAEQGPTHTVPAGWWQAALPLGSYALCGCTVAPGFDFADFALVATESDRTKIRALGDQYARFL